MTFHYTQHIVDVLYFCKENVFLTALLQLSMLFFALMIASMQGKKEKHVKSAKAKQVLQLDVPEITYDFLSYLLGNYFYI